ncbi:MAG: rseP, partial [Alphaproteobacteria bacterium]|nr:rseP [Alphaproteobacteria bacterium]
MEMLNKLLTTPFEFVRDYGGPFILVLAVLVFIHEWGHYIIARLCGVKIEKFSIGFGPEIWGRNDKHGTRWKICAVPLGGYVQMFGDSDPSSAAPAEGVTEGEQVRAYTEEEKKVAFFTQPLYKRAAIVFAGPAINYIFAILVLSTLFMFQGQPYMPPVAAKIVEPSAAFDAGVKPDDKIISVNGQAIDRFQDLRPITDMNIGKPMEVVIVHYTGMVEDGSGVKKATWDEKNPVTLSITPRKVVKEDRFGFRHEVGLMGIVSPESAFEMQKHGFFSAIGASLGETWRITTMTLKGLGQMIIGTRSTDELGGVLRIGAYAGDFASQGIIAFITFA